MDTTPDSPKTNENLPPLNERQELFCREYIIDFNGTKAAIRAGYSPVSATSTASEILTYPNVAARIKELKEDIFSAVGITQAKIYRELARLALSDIREAYGTNGSLKPLNELSDDIAAAIVGVKVYDEFEGSGEERTKIGETVEVKFADKLNALAQLVKIAGWNAPDKHELTGKNGGPVQITGMQIL